MAESLHHRFQAQTRFQQPDDAYQLAPFRITRIPGLDHSCLIVNEIGEYHFLSEAEFQRFNEGKLRQSEDVYRDLRSKHFLLDSTASVFRPFAAAQYRARKSFLFEGPSLHLFVVTLRCDHSCGYCQVSRRSPAAHLFDMSEATARLSVDRLFEAPSQDLKVEFQGGESSLAFDRVRSIVEDIESRNVAAGRQIDFVMATTLADITREQLEFCRDHKVHLSTSIDGPAELHNRNRPRPGRDSFQKAVAGIQLAREMLGRDSVSALLTVTRASLAHPEAIIDTYVELGFPSIFIRPLSHHGFARRTSHRLGYSTAEFLAFYDRALAHLFKVNLSGYYLEESYITLLFEHVFTPFSTGYVDLRSPTGSGLGVLVYNYDGYVYPSDEARMLVETGDAKFRLGCVEQPYKELMNSPVMKQLLEHGVAERLPVCQDCAFVPYCGADPINHWAHHRTLSGPAPEANCCERQMHLFRYLFRILHGRHDEIMRVLQSWWTRRPISALGAAQGIGSRA